MARPEQQQGLDEIIERIEETILPCISMMLDTLMDAVSLDQAGIEPQAFAAELRTLAFQLEALTRQVEEISPAHVDPQGYRLTSLA